MLVGKRCLQPISPYYIMENYPSSLANNSVFVGQNNLKFAKRHFLWSYWPCQNLEQIDFDLHNQVFDDVICKPSISGSAFKNLSE